MIDISTVQAREFAAIIASDIYEYIHTHKDEYDEFLSKEEQCKEVIYVDKD